MTISDESLERIITPFEQGLRALTDEYAIRKGIDPDVMFEDVKHLMNSEHIKDQHVYDATVYLSCAPKEATLTYERFWEILIGNRPMS